MQIFLDTANIQEIKELIQYGIIDGVTTNPSLISKINSTDDTKWFAAIKEICNCVDGDVSVEVIDREFEGMVENGGKVLDIASNVVLKLPLTWEGIKACNYFSKRGNKVNMTLCFSSNQALIAAKAGAEYVSPFIGRVDDIGYDGLRLIEDIKLIFTNYNIKTKIIAASIRNAYHIYKASQIGADICTAPASIIKGLLTNPLTDIGIVKFENDWNITK